MTDGKGIEGIDRRSCLNEGGNTGKPKTQQSPLGNLNIYLKAPFLSVLLDVAYARPHR